MLTVHQLILKCGDIEINPGPDSSAIKICHSNIRSLNEDSLSHINLDLCPNFDIICLPETNLLHGRNINFEIDLPGFQPPYRKDRFDQRGGGVAIYISDNVGCIRRTDYEVNNLELIWLEVRCLRNKKFFLCSCHLTQELVFGIYCKIVSVQ